MSEVAISLKNVSKCFRRYTHPSERLKEILLPGKNRADEFWALREANLKINKGETLGIVGQNGAGKSTLLQIIAGTLTPTTGEIAVNGRVSALLELGSGFNPEFTGRQNVFFNGRILGLSQAEIEKKFADIAAFADIGDFIEQPVRTYSSGMFVRLAFAVVVNTDPDILIVDEALAVGDVYFQQKCFERLRQLKASGVTLLFVSHDSSAVCKLCSEAILLEKGKIILHDQPKRVIDLYEAKLLQKQDTQPDLFLIEMTPTLSSEASSSETQSESLQTHEIAVASQAVQVEFVRLLDENDRPIQSILSDQDLQLAIGLTFLEALEDPHVGFRLRNRTGEVIFETNTFCMRKTIGAVSAGTFLETCFCFNVPLVAGEYTITIGVADSGAGEDQFKRALVLKHNTAVLKVLKNQDAITWSGAVNLNPRVEIRKQVYVCN